MQLHLGGISPKILILTFTDQEDFGVIFDVPLQVETISCTFIISQNKLQYCACVYVNNVIYVYNCIHEKSIKPSCILYLDTKSTHTCVIQCC